MASFNISVSPPNVPETVAERKTILVVDDEDKLRDILKIGLTRHGFSVLEAGSGEAALQLCQDYQGPIHLLLVDVVMPGMSGVELAPRVLTSRPDTKVILMSGFRDDQVFLNAALNPNTPFFHKPFTIDDLIKTIEDVLQIVR